MRHSSDCRCWECIDRQNRSPTARSWQPVTDREAARLLGELLAVIHGDGGHHQAAVGTAQAVQDAMTNWRAVATMQGAEPLAINPEFLQDQKGLPFIKRPTTRTRPTHGGYPTVLPRWMAGGPDRMFAMCYPRSALDKAADDGTDSMMGKL